MKTVLWCAAWSGVGVAAELGVAWLLLMYGSDRVCQSLLDA